MNLIFPAGIIAYLVYQGAKSTGDKIQKCEITSFKLGKVSVALTQTTIPVVVSVLNPNNSDVRAEYFRGVIYRAGKKLGEFVFDSSGQNVLLKSRQVTPLTFSVKLSNIGIVSSLVNIFKNISTATPLDTVFTINGIIQISGFDIPVNFSYDVKTGKEVKSAVSGIAGIGSAGEVIEHKGQRFYKLRDGRFAWMKPGENYPATYVNKTQAQQRLNALAATGINAFVLDYKNPFYVTIGGKIGQLDSNIVIRLKPLEQTPLSTQLMKLTGDSYNTFDWENADGRDLTADSGNILRHKKTGMLVKIPGKNGSNDALPFIIKKEGSDLQVGQILYTSWGYEQTNIDYYQVTKLKGKTQFEARRLSHASDFHSRNMAADVWPVGEYANQKIYKGSYREKSLKVDGRFAWRWDGEKKYATYYA